MKKLKTFIFCLLILSLPSNLGKHFITNNSYISGIVVDYLVPVIYTQDILVFLYLFITLGEFFTNTAYRVHFKKIATSLLSNWGFISLVLFTVSLLFSTLLSNYPFVSALYMLRIVGLVLLISFLLVDFNISEYRSYFLKYISISVILISLLGILQFINQGSVFDNYLVFGEQPYSSSTRGIIKENLFNTYVIPPYSLFRHPNTFAGFLALTLVCLFIYKQNIKPLLYKASMTLGTCSLFLTLSWVAILGFVLGILSLRLLILRKKIILVLFILVSFCFGLALPTVSTLPILKNEPSITRRSELLLGSYSITNQYFLFGKGIGTSTSLFSSSIYFSRDLSFFQPVHNIFVLILIEGGIFPLLFFLLFLFYLFKKTDSYSAILIVQILFLGSFDHYLLTMHQTFYLVFMLFGLRIAGFIPQKDLLAKN